MVTIARRVREFREAHGLSQAELARRACLSAWTLNHIERGRTKGVDFATLEKLSAALSVTPADLFAGEFP